MPNEIATMRRSLVPTTYAEAFEFAQHLSKSSMVPSDYRGRPENILLAIQWGMEVGLAPLQAIQNIAVINGKPSVYGDALLAMVKGSPVCDDVIESFEGSGDSLTAVCEARRKGKASAVAKFGVADAKKAGLWGKAGPWQQYPRRMLQMRARGFALRDAFPDVLRGVITREEAEDYPVDVNKGREPIDITPKADLDTFAATRAGETIDPETGEISETDAAAITALKGAANEKAMQGTEAFRAWWLTLDGADRDVVRPDLDTLKATADGADSRARDNDPFGLSPPAHNEPERPAAADTGRTVGGASPLQNFGKLVAALEPPRDQPDLIDGGPDWGRYADGMISLIGRASAADLAAVKFSALPNMQKLRLENGDEYRRVMDAVRERSAELQEAAA